MERVDVATWYKVFEIMGKIENVLMFVGLIIVIISFALFWAEDKSDETNVDVIARNRRERR